MNSCNQGDGFDIFGGGSITAPKIETVGGWETHDASKVFVPANTLAATPPNKAPNWHITVSPPMAGYTPTLTPKGCPDIGQTPIPDPFGTFPQAPTLGAGNPGRL